MSGNRGKMVRSYTATCASCGATGIFGSADASVTKTEAEAEARTRGWKKTREGWTHRECPGPDQLALLEDANLWFVHALRLALPILAAWEALGDGQQTALGTQLDVAGIKLGKAKEIRAIYTNLVGPACRVCGCTDAWGCEEGCWWVEADLCSNCTGEAETEGEP